MTMNLIKFKPCKKCASIRHRIIPYGHIDDYKRITYRISCPDCGYATKEKNTLEEAADAWNYPSSKWTYRKIL